MSGPRKRRKDRERRWLEQQTQDALEAREGPSEGMFYVLDTQTGEKFPGLNMKDARAKWQSLDKAMILKQDHYKPGRAPLTARFDAGKLP